MRNLTLPSFVRVVEFVKCDGEFESNFLVIV
jgi:hypothetical protein